MMFIVTQSGSLRGLDILGDLWVPLPQVLFQPDMPAWGGWATQNRRTDSAMETTEKQNSQKSKSACSNRNFITLLNHYAWVLMRLKFMRQAIRGTVSCWKLLLCWNAPFCCWLQMVMFFHHLTWNIDILLFSSCFLTNSVALLLH